MTKIIILSVTSECIQLVGINERKKGASRNCLSPRDRGYIECPSLSFFSPLHTPSIFAECNLQLDRDRVARPFRPFFFPPDFSRWYGRSCKRTLLHSDADSSHAREIRWIFHRHVRGRGGGSEISRIKKNIRDEF